MGKEQNSAGATFWWVFFGSRMAATEVGAPAMVEGMSQGLQDTTMSRFKGLDRMEDGWEEGVDINGGRRWCSMWVQLGLSLLDPSLGVAADSGPLQPPAWPQPSPTSSPLPILLIFHRRHLQHHRDNQFWPPTVATSTSCSRLWRLLPARARKEGEDVGGRIELLRASSARHL